MATITELITILREDYLDDTFDGWENATDEEKKDQFLWTDAFMIRSLNEAQRQACNRTDFLFDDSSKTTTIKLVQGKTHYDIDPRITYIEFIGYEGTKIPGLSKHEADRFYPEWRNWVGFTSNRYMNRIPNFCVLRGHTVRFVPAPGPEDDGKIINMEFFHLPYDEITSINSQISIPVEYHRDLIWWALYEAFIKPDADGYDEAKALLFRDKFESVFGGYVPSEVRFNQYNERKTLQLRPIDYNGTYYTNDYGGDTFSCFEDDRNW